MEKHVIKFEIEVTLASALDIETERQVVEDATERMLHQAKQLVGLPGYATIKELNARGYGLSPRPGDTIVSCSRGWRPV